MQGVAQLHGARLKLQRAEEHLGQLMAEHQEFLARNPYRMLGELDPDPRYQILWRAKIIEPPPLERWSSLVGECVHALRSSLDHTAYALVQLNRPGTEHAEFPVIKDKYVTDSEGTRLRWPVAGPQKLPGVGRRPLAQVKWLQPYRRRDGSERYDRLWVIHRMDIIDKHRRLNLVKPLVRDIGYVTNDCEVIRDERLAGPFEDGTPIARYAVRQTGPNVKVRAEFLFDVLFGEGEPLEGEPVMERLHDLLAYTGFIIARFDRFFV